VQGPGSPFQTSLELLGRLHQKCVCRFYNETMSKQNFFEVCCLFWMEQFLQGRAVKPKTLDGSLSSPKDLFKALRATYLSLSQQYDMSMIRWIMPEPSAITVINEPLAPVDDRQKEGDYFLSLSMQFWNEVYNAFNDEDNSALVNYENQGPTKRRRLLSRCIDGFSASEFNGKHNLSAAVLLLLVMLERCESWDQLVEWSKQLPEVFPTFSSNTIQTAVALVGLHCICQAIDIEGLSVAGLFHVYFVADSR
jgi:hypothetical protein